MEKWYVATKKADFNEWGRCLGVTPIVARLLRNRNMETIDQAREFLYGEIAQIPSPHLLKDADKAADIIIQAINTHQRIRVIGDYDVDGICSSYILTKGFQILGGEVDTMIPHRIHDGYGLNENLIREAAEQRISLIVTCDNGISAAAQIDLANSLGMEVVVTDHHEVPFRTESMEDGTEHKIEIIPNAKAVVDPKQVACEYPFDGICGASVAFKLLQILQEKTGSAGLQTALAEFMEFATIATVCDVMELRDENRILVREGLKKIRNTQNEGLKALLEVNSIDPANINTYQLGFVIGPCLNATGRLDSARRALELLQCYTKADAILAASELKMMNDSRKNMTIQGVEQAEKYIKEHHIEQDKVMVIYLPEVHESLAGIIAGRIKEEYNRPVFMMTRAETGVKGSGRSVEGYHMYEAMNQVKEYFEKFGGHAMAAGFSLKEENIELLRKALNEKCTLTDDDFIPKVHIDIALPFSYATLEIAEEIDLLEPYGVGNPKPLFAQKNVTFCGGARIGTNKNFARFLVADENGRKYTLLYFGNLPKFVDYVDDKYGNGTFEFLLAGKTSFPLSVVYQLGKNTFRGNTDVQYIMQYYC